MPVDADVRPEEQKDCSFTNVPGSWTVQPLNTSAVVGAVETLPHRLLRSVSRGLTRTLQPLVTDLLKNLQHLIPPIPHTDLQSTLPHSHSRHGCKYMYLVNVTPQSAPPPQRLTVQPKTAGTDSSHSLQTSSLLLRPKAALTALHLSKEVKSQVHT